MRTSRRLIVYFLILFLAVSTLSASAQASDGNFFAKIADFFANFKWGITGYAIQCWTNSDCPAGQFCYVWLPGCVANPLRDCPTQQFFCSSSAYCGDGSCNAGETCSTCPSDCGSCGGTPSPYCGDGNCDSGETCSSCSTDCGACSTGTTRKSDWSSCTSDSECQSGDCTNYDDNNLGICCPSGIVCCTRDWECHEGQVCENQRCVAQQYGSNELCYSCSSNSDCKSGYCIDFTSGIKKCAVRDYYTATCCGDNHYISNYQQGSDCCVDSECSSGKKCVNYKCTESICSGTMDDYADLGTSDDVCHNPIGWYQDYTYSDGTTVKWMNIGTEQTIDLWINNPNEVNMLEIRHADGECDDSFEVYIGGERIYNYKHDGSGFQTPWIPIKSSLLPNNKVTVTFKNTASDSCGRAGIDWVKLRKSPGTKKICEACSMNSDCESGRCAYNERQGGRCYTPEATFTMEEGAGCCDNTNCHSGYACANYQCRKIKQAGESCSSNAECSSGNCQNNVCCSSGSCCASDNQCQEGYKCDTKKYSCVKKGILSRITPAKKQESEFLESFYKTYDLAPRYRDGKQIPRSAMYNGYYYFYKEQTEQIDLPVATLGKFTIILDDFKALAMDVVSLNPISFVIDLKSFADDIDAKISSDTGPLVNIMINAYSIGSLGLDIARKSAKVDVAVGRLTSNFPSNKVTRAISSRQEALRKKIAPTEEVENQLFVLSIVDFVMEKTLISDVRQTFDFSMVDYSMKIQLSMMARELSKLYLKAEARTLTEQEAIILMILEHDFWSMVAARQENFINNEKEAGIFKKSWNQVVQKLLLYDYDSDVAAAQSIEDYADSFVISIDKSRKELFGGKG